MSGDPVIDQAVERIVEDYLERDDRGAVAFMDVMTDALALYGEDTARRVGARLADTLTPADRALLSEALRG